MFTTMLEAIEKLLILQDRDRKLAHAVIGGLREAGGLDGARQSHEKTDRPHRRGDAPKSGDANAEVRASRGESPVAWPSA